MPSGLTRSNTHQDLEVLNQWLAYTGPLPFDEWLATYHRHIAREVQ